MAHPAHARHTDSDNQRASDEARRDEVRDEVNASGQPKG
jgi:hypothetical protein